MTTARSLHLALGTLLLASSFASGCDEESLDPTGGGGATGGGGEGGSGGAPPGCPVGSHDDGTGACIAALGQFQTGPELTARRDHHMTWAAKSASGTFLYAAGGVEDQSAAVTSIERAAIAEDGSLGAWETLAVSTDASGAVIVATDELVVLAGGFRGNNPATKTVDIMTIAGDGTLSDPVDGPFMSAGRFHGAGVLVNGFIYAVGGQDGGGSSLSSVERSSLTGTTLSAWTLDTPMPEERSHQGLATDGEALYVTGGLKRVDGDFENDLPYDTVLRSVIGEDGALADWESLGQLPVALGIHSSFMHAGQLYIIGGLELEVSKFVKRIHRAPVAAEGALGAWEELSVELPKSRGHSHQTPMVNGFLYSVGGFNNLGSQPESYFAKFE